MATYRLYYCSPDGKHFGVDDFQAVDDADAVERAALRAVSRVPVYEIWIGERLVYRGSSK